VIWPGFPKRLLSALKSLCCLADSGGTMQSQEIAKKIDVSKAETAKVLQLLAWGGFVTSQRGYKGGFHLAKGADQITTGEVMDFFFSKHPPERDGIVPFCALFENPLPPARKRLGA
jgi:Rrf2 family protein